jgi:hypothetical protein
MFHDAFWEHFEHVVPLFSPVPHWAPRPSCPGRQTSGLCRRRIPWLTPSPQSLRSGCCLLVAGWVHHGLGLKAFADSHHMAMVSKHSENNFPVLTSPRNWPKFESLQMTKSLRANAGSRAGTRDRESQDTLIVRRSMSEPNHQGH